MTRVTESLTRFMRFDLALRNAKGLTSAYSCTEFDPETGVDARDWNDEDEEMLCADCACRRSLTRRTQWIRGRRYAALRSLRAAYLKQVQP